MNTELPDRCWILTHPEWKDDATRQTFEVILSESTARGYVSMIADSDAARSCEGFEIAEYRLVRTDTLSGSAGGR